MKKQVITALLLFAAPLGLIAGEIKLIVKYSEELAVFTFLQHLNEEGTDHPHKKIFQESKFNTPDYQLAVKQFNAVAYNDYFFSYKAYRHKNDFYAESFIKNKFVTGKSRQEMKQGLSGLLSNDDLNTVFRVMELFTPIYNELIFNPNKNEFEKHLANLKNEIKEKNIQAYFEQAKIFYSSGWDADLPLYMAFYPLLNAKGFSATAYNNISECALPLLITNYITILSVLLHESVHLLYEEQPIKVQDEWESWFNQSKSPYSRFAQDILNESWATAVANGYFVYKMTGALSPGKWYNWKYNDSMARKAYPLFQQYLENGKPADNFFADKYIQVFEDSCKGWIQELPFLMANRNIMTSGKGHIDTINRLFRYRSIANEFTDYSTESFEKLKKGTIKFIIISENHEKVHAAIRNNFSELKNWKVNLTKDFMGMKLLEDKSALVIINLVKKDLGYFLRKLKVELLKL